MKEHFIKDDIVKYIKRRLYGLIINYFTLIIVTTILFVVLAALSFYLIFGKNTTTYDSRLGFIVLLAAGYVLWITLKPLLGLFRNANNNGKIITRKECPAFFDIIDEVTKETHCLPPKRVRVSCDCNAYVFYPSILGYLLSKRQNLTIGLPLLQGMNVTELKSVLFHEFQHFSQDSMMINRIANLSEFVCLTINNSQQHLNSIENPSARIAGWYTKGIVKILMPSYSAIAPHNSVLSRLQEYDADQNSLAHVGTEGCISALCKLCYNSYNWSYYQNLLIPFVKQGRMPVNTMEGFAITCRHLNSNKGIILDPEIQLFTPPTKRESRIGFSVNLSTHPSIEDRVFELKTLPFITTSWDKTSALSLFNEILIKKVFDDVEWRVREIVMPGNRVYSLIKNISNQEIETYLSLLPPPYLEFFRKEGVFLLEESYLQKDTYSALGVIDSNPFSEENANVLFEYYIAKKDYQTLLSIENEGSSNRTFSYNGQTYSGDDVPIEEHLDYYESLRAKALFIAELCNQWLDYKANDKGVEHILRLFRLASCAQYELTTIKDATNEYREFVKLGTPIDYLPEVQSFIKVFKEKVSLCLEKDSDGETCPFTIMADSLGWDKKAICQVASFMENEKLPSTMVAESMTTITDVLNNYAHYGWDWVKRELILKQ